MVEPEVTQPEAAKAAPVFHSISWAISRAVAAISKDRTATSLALFGFLIVKVLLVTHGDLLTSLALVNAAGVVAVVIGVVVSSLPIAAAVGMAGALYGCTSCRWRGAGPRKQWSIIALVGLVSAWFTPWFLFVPALALAVLLGAVDWFRASGRPADSVSKLRRGAGRSALVLTVVTLVVATGATLFTMWLPQRAADAE